MKNLFVLLFVIITPLSFSYAQVITIAEAIEDLNGDLIPDRLGQIVTIQGVVYSPNYQSIHSSYYIDDGTAGTNIFMYGPYVFYWSLGDLLQITGSVYQYNGITEIIPADTSGWVFLSSGNPLPIPTVLTLSEYFVNPETFEGSLIGFVNLTMVGGNWPPFGMSATVQVSDGIDTLDMRIDSDTDIDNNPEPTWPKDIIGIGSQFTSNIPPNDGYQILPRFYSDFLPPGTIPVELTSFTVKIFEGKITLQWATETETNNKGFEVQRKTTENEFEKIGFVPGFGTTTEPKLYSFTDSEVSSGKYSYRLKQIDFDGSFGYSDEVEIEVSTPLEFSLLQNYPNPFNPITKISWQSPVSSRQTLKVYDILGNEVATLVDEEKPAGKYEVEFDASALPSGVYFYQINAGEFVNTKNMILLK
jgi:hypothetical protein